MTEPDQIVVAGDWHGNGPWACGVTSLLRGLIPSKSPRLLLHLGDFGIWPGRAGARYLDDVDAALKAADAELWFVDGNHEDFNQLHALEGFNPDQPAPVQVTDRIAWLPRGYRWQWHGRTWLALGGGISVDRAMRRNQISWWPEEAITPAQAKQVIADGVADVMVCHDAPSTVPIVYPSPAPACWDPADTRASDHHRDLLQAVVDEVHPAHLLHGHHHMEHDFTVPMLHGPVQVTGLDMDGATQGNYRVLDVRTMQWIR